MPLNSLQRASCVQSENGPLRSTGRAISTAFSLEKSLAWCRDDVLMGATWVEVLLKVRQHRTEQTSTLKTAGGSACRVMRLLETDVKLIATDDAFVDQHVRKNR
jgi:hypothetical protein